MIDAQTTRTVRVTHRFAAKAERVYDAFLDPDKAARFLFATPTGQIVRCDIDARVGGAFSIVDRRNGEDVTHAGTYVELDRPHRIVFTFLVEKYSSERSKVTIDIRPLPRGCELTLTHEIPAAFAAFEERTRSGWEAILDVAAELLGDETPTCGAGIAQHAAIPAAFAEMSDGLAQTFALHRRMLQLEDAAARQEGDVYRELGDRWGRIRDLVKEAAARMEAQRELPMGAHDESAWGPEHAAAFEKFVTSQSHLLALLRIAAPRDEEALASIRAATTSTTATTSPTTTEPER
jgi:uncharacterized protein YndB with AHSA1/START domain